MPVIAARLTFVAIHTLLHHGPGAVIGHEKPVQIEIEAVLNGSAVDLGDEPAGARETGAVYADAIPKGGEFFRGSP